MNRKSFLKSMLSLPVVASVFPAVAVAKPVVVDKYADPSYGNTFKTVDSIFTVREIEMMCREWGWHHVETFLRKYDDLNAQNWMFQEGIGFFIGVDGNEYQTWSTMRSMWYNTSPYDRKAKEAFKPFLKQIAGDYYWKGKREHYYFYDVLMPRDGYYIHDAYHDFDGKVIENPHRDSIEGHGKKFNKVILYHMGVTHGKMWGYIKDQV